MVLTLIPVSNDHSTFECGYHENRFSVWSGIWRSKKNSAYHSPKVLGDFNTKVCSFFSSFLCARETGNATVEKPLKDIFIISSGMKNERARFQHMEFLFSFKLFLENWKCSRKTKKKKKRAQKCESFLFIELSPWISKYLSYGMSQFSSMLWNFSMKLTFKLGWFQKEKEIFICNV